MVPLYEIILMRSLKDEKFLANLQRVKRRISKESLKSMGSIDTPSRPVRDFY
jgi:hypothetical protein